ncbi:hypothetical protein VA596_04260 [Amycolatopsis sp., V23-08]|uniref:Uncharacterized protein n=1 Tax=Amycolatopsis heterodermiae TaxID=3110235 RepID=A0ABU5QXS6_9PSEU|nr:hypothetical protein [Amycolatopsis sp., V23-08]MEA5358738.1 hypothetical protein [Amycolatopsis sp., V23-08]
MGRAERIIRKRIELERQARPTRPASSRIFKSNYETQSPIIRADMAIRGFVAYMESNDYPGGQIIGRRAAWHVGSFMRYHYETTNVGNIYITADGEFLLVEASGSVSKPVSFSRLCALMANTPKHEYESFSADKVMQNIERLAAAAG